MSGVKGKSGRRGYDEEKAIEDILKLSYATVWQFLRDPAMPQEKKAYLASEFAKRRVTNRQEQKIEIKQEERALLDHYSTLAIPSPTNRIEQAITS